MHKHFCLILILLIAFSCTRLDKNDSNSLNSILANEFNEHDIEELRTILSFFDNNVKNQTKIESINSGYNEYMENLRLSDSWKDFENKLMIDKSQIDSFISASKENLVFNKIYTIQYGTNINRTDTLSYELVPNIQGDYIKLLNKTIEIDTTFILYKESVESAGAIGPTLALGFQNIHEQLDFNNELIRLIVAIHYISLKSSTKLSG